MEASVGCKDRLPRIKMMICKRRKQVAKAMPVKGEKWNWIIPPSFNFLPNEKLNNGRCLS